MQLATFCWPFFIVQWIIKRKCGWLGLRQITVYADLFDAIELTMQKLLH